MRQFDVYENPSPDARRFAPYLVVLSSHLLLDFDYQVTRGFLNRRETYLDVLLADD